ncbi:hypothetical protein ACHAQA_005882 [Verticillium albo-atrum]
MSVRGNIQQGPLTGMCNHVVCNNCAVLDIVTFSWKCCKCHQLTIGGTAMHDEPKAVVSEQVDRPNPPTEK